MAPTRRTLLQASPVGFAGSIAGLAGVTETKQDTETTDWTTTISPLTLAFAKPTVACVMTLGTLNSSLTTIRRN